MMHVLRKKFFVPSTTMRILMFLWVLSAGFSYSSAQYILKDHRDSIGEPQLFSTVEELSDSFYSKLRFQHERTIQLFIPSVGAMARAMDSMNLKYTEAELAIKTEIIQKNVERKYKKILKRAKRDNILFKKFERTNTKYDYGSSEEGYEFCYVTIQCARRSKEMTVYFLAIKLDHHWYLGDELSIYWD